MIETDELSKTFGSIHAVDNLTFSVGAGEVLGFLGPNGAGKSTTMKMIAGFLTPSRGRASVFGHDVVSDSLAARRMIGYLPEGAPAYGEMTPRQFLSFVADIRELTGEDKSTAIARVVDQLHLEGVLAQPIETLSKGFKRRVGLAQAIIHDPRVLVLDEPTDGLDPNQKHEVRELIQSMASDKIIVISTHILEEVHALCTRAIIIADGRILADDTPQGLESRSRYHDAVSIRVPDLKQARQVIAALEGVERVSVDAVERQITAFPKPGKQIFWPISDLVRDRGWSLESLELETGRLDEVFRSITTAGGAQ